MERWLWRQQRTTATTAPREKGASSRFASFYDICFACSRESESERRSKSSGKEKKSCARAAATKGKQKEQDQQQQAMEFFFFFFCFAPRLTTLSIHFPFFSILSSSLPRNETRASALSLALSRKQQPPLRMAPLRAVLSASRIGADIGGTTTAATAAATSRVIAAAPGRRAPTHAAAAAVFVAASSSSSQHLSETRLSGPDHAGRHMDSAGGSKQVRRRTRRGGRSKDKNDGAAAASAAAASAPSFVAAASASSSLESSASAPEASSAPRAGLSAALEGDFLCSLCAERWRVVSKAQLSGDKGGDRWIKKIRNCERRKKSSAGG